MRKIKISREEQEELKSYANDIDFQKLRVMAGIELIERFERKELVLGITLFVSIGINIMLLIILLR